MSCMEIPVRVARGWTRAIRHRQRDTVVTRGGQIDACIHRITAIGPRPHSFNHTAGRIFPVLIARQLETLRRPLVFAAKIQTRQRDSSANPARPVRRHRNARNLHRAQARDRREEFQTIRRPPDSKASTPWRNAFSIRAGALLRPTSFGFSAVSAVGTCAIGGGDRFA